MEQYDYSQPYITRDEYLIVKGIDLSIELQDDDNASNKVNRFIQDITNFVLDHLVMEYNCNELNRQFNNFEDLAEFRRVRFHYGVMEQIEYVLNNGLIHLDSGINRETGAITDFSGIVIGPSALKQFRLGGFCNKQEGRGHHTDLSPKDMPTIEELVLELGKKVDKVDGKGLSKNDYTDSDKMLLKDTARDLDGKVDKESGKVLSDNNFSDAYKEKVDGIEAGAEQNVIEEIRYNNNPLTPTGKAVNIDTSDKEDKANKVTSVSASSTDAKYPSAKAVHNAVESAKASANAYADSKVTRANLVQVLGEASTYLNGLMSAQDKERLDVLYALLGDSEDADTVVDTINEVLAIFNQYPEGAEIVNILSGKSNATNIENGTGTNAILQKMANATVNFTGRNPNAEALDSSLSAILPTGASGNQSAAFGKDTMALAIASFTNGNKCVAKGEESHAEGYQSVTLGDGSHAEGSSTVAKGLQSHSEGGSTQALGDGSHAEGYYTVAGALASHTEGSGTKTGNYSQESGIGANQSGSGSGGGGDTPSNPYTAEYGEGSHAEGYDNIVKGCGSHAEGLRNYLDGNYSHVEGVNNTNSGNYAVVSGFNNINAGDVSFVCGNWNINSGYGSLIAGNHNKNTHDNKSVFGKYNEDKSDTLFEVGNGTADNTRSNAFEVYQDGHVEIGAMGSTKKSVATKEYVDGVVPTKQATTTIIVNALTNINGRVLSNYQETDDIEVLATNSYKVKLITYQGNRCTEAQAIAYMKYMTGSEFLPTFNYQEPANSLFIMSDGSLWKPQFDTTNGLKLYNIPSPIVTKHKDFVKAIRVDGSSDKHYIIFDSPVTLLAGSFKSKKSKLKYYKASDLSRNKKGNHILRDMNENLLQLPAGRYSYAYILKYVLDKILFEPIVNYEELGEPEIQITETLLSTGDLTEQDVDYYGGISGKTFQSLFTDDAPPKTFYRGYNSGSTISIDESTLINYYTRKRFIDNVGMNTSLRIRFVKNFNLKNDSVNSGWTGQMSNYQMKIMVNYYREDMFYLDDFYATMKVTK